MRLVSINRLQRRYFSQLQYKYMQYATNTVKRQMISHKNSMRTYSTNHVEKSVEKPVYQSESDPMDDPKVTEFLLSLERLLKEEKNHEQGQKVFSKLKAYLGIEKIPLNGVFNGKLFAYQLALLLMREQEGKNKGLYSAILLDESLLISEVDDDFLVECASILENVQQEQTALKILKFVSERNPRNVTYLYLIGNLHLKLKHFTFARDYYQECIDKEPNFQRAYLELTKLYEMDGNWARALKSHQTYLHHFYSNLNLEDKNILSHWVHAQATYAHLQCMNHDLDGSIQTYNEIMKKDPLRFDILYEWTITLFRKLEVDQKKHESIKVIEDLVERFKPKEDLNMLPFYYLVKLRVNLYSLALEPITHEEYQKKHQSLLNSCQEAWDSSQSRDHKLLVIWEITNLQPNTEFLTDVLLKWIVSEPSIHINNYQIWYQFRKQLETSSAEPKQIKVNNQSEFDAVSYDVELYIEHPGEAKRKLIIIAESTKQARHYAKQYLDALNLEGSMITEVQHPSRYLTIDQVEKDAVFPGIINAHYSV